MSLQRMIQWLLLAVTAALLMFLKWLHLGVTHYNIFLLILIGWTLALLIVFRTLTADQRIKD
jgi:predicted membrane chloride channel (bestrophin family)